MLIDELYPRYFDSLFAGDKANCRDIVWQLMKADVGLKDLYEQLFKRSLYQIGDLWSYQRATVADEHLATSITEDLLALLYPRLLTRPRIGRSAIIACVAEEWHHLGAKMVADLLESLGWDTLFLGANTPLSDLLHMIERRRPDFVGLSLALASNRASMDRALAAIASNWPDLKVLVGGQFLNESHPALPSSLPHVHLASSLDGLERFLLEHKMDVSGQRV